LPRNVVGRSQDELISRISKEKARLAALTKQQEQSRKRLEALERQLAGIPSTLSDTSGPEAQDGTAPKTPSEKVGLFRSLFRGRPDVFPTRFVSKKTGRSGYAPACANKFVRGVCELPRVRCGECPNQAFIAADDQAILNHLRGRYVMGVYPLLEDDTCWLLAADFDKTSWKADVAAFVGTCHSLGVPVAVERSRSGNGAHAWFFFTAPVPAAAARKMGCHLITQTMARRHELSMESYDRLFPNQDTMPRGGFGNLIALPLQQEARREGNTLFLDGDLRPYPDQWGYLASVPRMASAKVEQIAREATRTGLVVGVRPAGLADEDDATPWRRPASRTTRPSSIPGPLPQKVRAVIAQRLFVEKSGLPSVLLNEIKRLAAFQNPEFYKKQMMRLSTAGTPRVVSCAEDLPKHISLPRGCGPDVEKLLKQHDVALAVVDKRHAAEPLDVRFQGELTGLQERAAKALLEQDLGVFVAPPGMGKTVLGTYMTAARGRSTLVLVHRRPLLDQWVAQLSMFLGIDQKKIGRIGGGAMRTAGIENATFQTLRHTAAAWMVQDGVSLYEVQHVLGHSTPVMTQRYAHLQPDHLRRAVGAVDKKLKASKKTPKRRSK
jgi:hypothetical protein